MEYKPTPLEQAQWEFHVVACEKLPYQGVACKLLFPIYNAKSTLGLRIFVQNCDSHVLVRVHHNKLFLFTLTLKTKQQQQSLLSQTCWGRLKV